MTLRSSDSAFLATVVVVLRLLRLYEHQHAHRDLLTLFVGLTALIVSLFSALNWTKFIELLVTLFGRDADLDHYWILLGAMLLLSLFVYFGHSMKESQQEQENQQN